MATASASGHDPAVLQLIPSAGPALAMSEHVPVEFTANSIPLVESAKSLYPKEPAVSKVKPPRKAPPNPAAPLAPVQVVQGSVTTLPSGVIFAIVPHEFPNVQTPVPANTVPPVKFPNPGETARYTSSAPVKLGAKAVTVPEESTCSNFCVPK